MGAILVRSPTFRHVGIFHTTCNANECLPDLVNTIQQCTGNTMHNTPKNSTTINTTVSPPPPPAPLQVRKLFCSKLEGGSEAVEGVRLVRDKTTLIGKGFGYVLLADRALAAAVSPPDFLRKFCFCCTFVIR